MKEQHKAMAIALRDSEFDDDTEAGPDEGAPPDEPFDVEAFERAAEAHQAESPLWASFDESAGAAKKTPDADRGSYELPAQQPMERPRKASGSIFGSDPQEEKSLDEVILSYLTEDSDEDG
jgi:hypothetical protein